jgi:hypothetical protein
LLIKYIVTPEHDTFVFICPSREVPSLEAGPPELGNLVATLVVALSNAMDDELTMYKGFECLDRIFQMATKRNLGDPSSAIPIIFTYVLQRLEERFVILAFAMFLGLANARPGRDDIHQVLLQQVGHRLQEQYGDGIEMEILVSMNVALAVRGQTGKCLIAEILFTSMEAMVGRTFRDTFSALGLKRMLKDRVKEHSKEGREGIRRIKKENKGRTGQSYERMMKEERKLRRLAEKSL